MFDIEKITNAEKQPQKRGRKPRAIETRPFVTLTTTRSNMGILRLNGAAMSALKLSVNDQRVMIGTSYKDEFTGFVASLYIANTNSSDLQLVKAKGNNTRNTTKKYRTVPVCKNLNVTSNPFFRLLCKEADIETSEAEGSVFLLENSLESDDSVYSLKYVGNQKQGTGIFATIDLVEDATEDEVQQEQQVEDDEVSLNTEQL